MSHFEMHQISAFPVQEHHKQPSQAVHAWVYVELLSQLTTHAKILSGALKLGVGWGIIPRG